MILEHMGEKVKIGAACGFVYCDYVNEKTIDTIERYGEKSHKEYKRYYREINSTYKRFDKIRDKKEASIIELWLHRKELKSSQIPKTVKRFMRFDTLQGIKRELKKDRKQEFEKLEERKEELEFYIKNYKPWLDREVKETYLSFLDPKETIILFDGIEKGKYWDREEYLKGVNNG